VTAHSRRVSGRSLRQALDFGPRPDPALGIFETMLVTDGELPMRDEHYTRISASALELYGVELALPAVTNSQRDWTGRSRLTFIPGEGLSAESGTIGPDPVYTSIAAFVLPGGLGPHKWADRRMLDAITSEAGDGVLPLLVDSDGSVLETTRTNVLIEEHGRLISPPADRRARPGVGRRRLQYDEEPVDLDRLLAADAVVLTSALRVLRLPGGLPLVGCR
jgi:para-aminobenzoate synthetase/4-amino-4-deoxychorismate lyase